MPGKTLKKQRALLSPNFVIVIMTLSRIEITLIILPIQDLQLAMTLSHLE